MSFKRRFCKKAPSPLSPEDEALIKGAKTQEEKIVAASILIEKILIEEVQGQCIKQEEEEKRAINRLARMSPKELGLL